MILIIPNIQNNVTHADIRNFIKPALKGFWPFIRMGYIEKIKINIYCTTVNDIKIGHYALITVDSERLANRIIKKLNATKLLNKRVYVRIYQIRSWHNDRRQNHAQKTDDIYLGKRRGDRRHIKVLEEIPDVSKMFVLVDIARKLI